MSSIVNEPRLLKQDKMTIKIFPTTEAMGEGAAREVAAKMRELLARKDEINMIFAAAPSQEAFLKNLISYTNIEWERINAYHMDEYMGLPADAPQSFGNFLRQRIFDRVPFKTVNCIDGNAPIHEECERYSALLEAHPVDIVCLGIGENAHVAFNDPGFAFFNDPVAMKPVVLDPVCRRQQVNEKCFERLDQVPTHALTLTVPALTRAPWMFCIVPFTGKAEAVRKTVKGEITEAVPATILRTKENSILYLTYESASLL